MIACDPIAGLSATEGDALCRLLVKKAAVLTDLPVSLADAADLDRSNLDRQGKELLLRVTGTATPVDADRRTIALTVTPIRAARPIGRGQPVGSSVSLVRLQGDWVLQGPVDAFATLLGPTRQRRLRAPPTAD